MTYKNLLKGRKMSRWGCHYATSSAELYKQKVPKTLPQMVENINALGWHCFQIFFGSPKTLERKNPSKVEKQQTLQLLQKYNIQLITHFPYTFNLCRADCQMWSLQTELSRVGEMNGRVVVHIGMAVEQLTNTNREVLDDLVHNRHTSKVEQWEKQWHVAVDQIVANLKTLTLPDHFDYPLLLEPPAGEGRKIGWRTEQLKYLFEQLDQHLEFKNEKGKANVGFCLDTCHAFAAGACRFDTIAAVETYFHELDAAFGLERLKLIHLNDSSDEFLALKDNHAILTHGNIWSHEDHVDGLMHLWQLARKHGIDVVSEVGSPIDVEVMKMMS